MARELEDGRSYTPEAIMMMGYMIRHGFERPYAIEPDRLWPRYELDPDVMKDGKFVYKVRGKMAKESGNVMISFDSWLESKQGSSPKQPGFTGDRGPGKAGHAKSVETGAEKRRGDMRARLRKALAAAPKPAESPEGGDAGVPAEIPGGVDLSGGIE